MNPHTARPTTDFCCESGIQCGFTHLKRHFMQESLHRRIIPLTKLAVTHPSAIAVMLVAVATLMLLACTNGNANAPAHPTSQLQAVRGHVTRVEAHAVIALDVLEIVDADGNLWHFEGRGKVVNEFTPSHLNDHMLLGESVEVSFYRDGGALVIHNITD